MCEFVQLSAGWGFNGIELGTANLVAWDIGAVNAADQRFVLSGRSVKLSIRYFNDDGFEVAYFMPDTDTIVIFNKPRPWSPENFQHLENWHPLWISKTRGKDYVGF